jgi:hypothetical protein
VSFDEETKNYLGSDRLFGSAVAWQGTSLSTEARRHVGMTTLVGGGTNGSHVFPSGAVFLEDDVSPTQPWVGVTNAFGSGNVCTSGGIARSGDFTTTRPFRPVNTFFIGQNFVLTKNAGDCGNTASVQVNDVPKMGDHCCDVPDDQEIGVTKSLGSFHQLRDPVQRLGHSSPRQHVGQQSPKYRHQAIVATKRVRQVQRWVQAVPDLLSWPAFERHPRGAQQRPQIELAAVALRRRRQRRDQLQPLVQMSPR